MRLRNVRLDDVDAYVRMRCDPVMMADLGGPMSREQMAAKVAKDVADVAADRAWIKMIDIDGEVAGTVALFTNDSGESEVGWMVLADFQGCGIGRSAVQALLDAGRLDGRWGRVFATPSVTNGASNGICRALEFTLLGDEEIEFAGRKLHVNRWYIDL